jgi:hypothetical protein
MKQNDYEGSPAENLAFRTLPEGKDFELMDFNSLDTNSMIVLKSLKSNN